MQLLKPAMVWRHFQTLCSIPRPSKHETQVREHLRRWAQARGISTQVDDAGNLLLRKAATPGYEDRPSVVMQAHLDMVCQANAPAAGDAAFDFLQQPITPRIAEGWLCAEQTTLGADNGIGVALALAALEDDTLRHGPLEVLLTVDEEAGMGGAHGLAPSWLQSRLMLNLDTEEWGEFYLGCAGGCDVNVERHCASEPLPPEHELWQLDISGLLGGHSGCDIHLGRGNANRILAQTLQGLDTELPGGVHLVSLAGGTARNALPREATALFACRLGEGAVLAARLDALQTEVRATLAGIDDGLTFALRPASRERIERRVLAREVQGELLAALCRSPYGVRTMSPDFAGVVESSNNLGILRLQDGEFSANLMVRSLRDTATREVAAKIEAVFLTAACRVRIDGHYPGWTPNPASPLLALCQRVYRDTFDGESRVQVIHAGLECGIIGAKYPGLDTVSFGPTIRGAHAPGERVEIASVGRVWELLRAVLTRIASEDAGAS
jgi:dipeptidase D